MPEIQNGNIQILKIRSTLLEISSAFESLPLRGGRWRRRRRMRANHTVKSLLKVIPAMFAQRTEGFPLGGKKTASSLSRKRLMRGDQSALTKGIHSLRTPLTNRVRSRTFCRHAPPDTPKLPCAATAARKRKKSLPSLRRLPCREVRGGSGRFGG